MAAKERFSEGNAAFVEEEYDKANELYSEAIGEDDTKDEFFTARAQARIKLGNYRDAVLDASKAIELNSSNVKSYLRKGIAQFHLEDYQQSADTLRKGFALDANDKNISTWLRKCEAELDLQQKNKCNASSENSVTYGCSSNQNTTKEDVRKQEVSTPNSSASSCQVAADPNVPKVPMPSGPKTRYDWYQTETHVVITILIKNVKKEDLQTDIEERSLSVMIKLPTASDYSLHLDLSHDIVPAQSLVKVLGSKVEVKLKKSDGVRWGKLEGELEDTKVKQFNPASSDTSAPVKYPSSSQHTRDWDKLVTEIKKEEKEEKPEGDAAVNQLFQQIYADGNDEVRRAMNKSFVESGGTVLSTNWKEIKQKKTDVKPPDGMEYKNYS